MKKVKQIVAVVLAVLGIVVILQNTDGGGVVPFRASAVRRAAAQQGRPFPFHRTTRHPGFARTPQGNGSRLLNAARAMAVP